MNLKEISIALFITLVISACNNTAGGISKKDAENLSKSGCYNTANEKIVELLNIVLDEKGISGTGKRSYLASTRFSNLP